MKTINNITKANFDQVYTAYSGELQHFAFSKTHNFELSCELVNDAMLKAFANLDNFNNELSSLKTWIYNILKNCIIDNYRSNRVKRESEYLSENITIFSPSITQNPESILIENELNSLIMSYINELKGNYKQVCLLFFINDLSLNEIAEILGLSMANVKIIIFRSREALQSKLKRAVYA